jgi:aliphatic sulfonates family ABC transporter substrate-binding protein
MPVLELSRPDVPEMRARALVFEAPRSRALLKHVEQIAPTHATVLITGETGTGKEIIARYVHDRSARARAPFVAINCGALTPSLVESELFGHERGAFTGALASRAGWFEEADKGTLFLDEIADLPLAAQVKLLRVLQEHEVVRVGSRRPVPIDVRLIAATNANLELAVAEGRFREDLYYRLHVALVAIAPLRDRPEDIVPLARHFLARYAARMGIVGAELTEAAIERLLAHPWPGNIRELENVVHRALLGARGGVVTAREVELVAGGGGLQSQPPPAPVAPAPKSAPPGAAPDARAALEEALRALFEEEHPSLHDEIEEIVFRTAYRSSDNNQLRTARLLGISRNVVRARLLQYGLLPSGPPASEAPTTAVARSLRRRRGARPRARIGTQSFGVLSLLKATRALEEALDAHGFDVEWADCATGMHVIDALAASVLDLGVVGEAPPVFGQASRAPVVYLASEPPAPEGEAIVVLEGSRVVTLADLRGKSLAVSRGANVLYFVVRALEEVGLTLDDVDVRSLSPAAARDAFALGEVDAWAIWNPILASLQESLRTRVVRDASGLASNRAFYVGRRAFADAHPAVVEAFVGQVRAVGCWANESREFAARTLASHVSLPQWAIEAAFARTPFDARPLDAEAVASQQRIADTFHRLRLIPHPVHVNDAVWSPR